MPLSPSSTTHSPIRMSEPEELSEYARPLTVKPVRRAAQAVSTLEGSPAPAPGLIEMARGVLLCVCPFLHPLQTLLCAAFCTSRAVVSDLLPVTHDQRTLVPVDTLWRTLLAVTCVGIVQQRPGSNLPKLRAGQLGNLAFYIGH
jgi:hypothetical protein